MNYIDFDESRKYDIILLGRIGIDFNPAYSDDVKEDFKPLKKVHYFEKFVGGSPANIAVGITHHGMKAGFIGKVSNDQFGDFVVDYFSSARFPMISSVISLLIISMSRVLTPPTSPDAPTVRSSV